MKLLCMIVLEKIQNQIMNNFLIDKGLELL